MSENAVGKEFATLSKMADGAKTTSNFKMQKRSESENIENMVNVTHSHPISRFKAETEWAKSMEYPAWVGSKERQDD